jgi:hypothetical protein
VYYEKALAGFQSRLGAEPGSLLAKEDLAITHYYVATAALRAGDRKAAAHIREKLVGDPKAKLNIIDLMIARARCGQHQLASKTADDIIPLPPLDARVYFQAACGFSLCAGAVAADSGFRLTQAGQSPWAASENSVNSQTKACAGLFTTFEKC